MKAGGKEGKRGQKRVKWLDAIIDSMDTSLSRLQETVEDREAWRAAVHGVMKSHSGQYKEIIEISETIRAHEGGPDQKVTVEGARVDIEDTQVG